MGFDDTGTRAARSATANDLYRSWYAITGEPHITVQSWLARIHPRDVTRVREAWDLARTTGHIREEYRVRNREGRYVWIRSWGARRLRPCGAEEWVGRFRALSAGDHRHVCIPGSCYCGAS